MAKTSKPKGSQAPAGVKVVATNRRARRDYEIIETIETGMVLHGAEVKSLRESKVQLSDSYARIDDGELWLVGLHIAPYSQAGPYSPAPERKRKLLANRTEIDRLSSRVDQERLALVPLRLYFKDGRAKLEIGLGKGRRYIDKRQVIAQRDADLEARRAMARSASGKGKPADR